MATDDRSGFVTSSAWLCRGEQLFRWPGQPAQAPARCPDLPTHLLAKDPPEATETAAVWYLTGVRHSHIVFNLTLQYLFIKTHVLLARACNERHTQKIKYVLESNKKVC